MRASVNIKVEFELADPDHYPENVTTWLEAAQYDIEHSVSVDGDIDLTVTYGEVELEGDDSDKFTRQELLE